MSGRDSQPTLPAEDDLIAVEAVLGIGDRVAVPVGTMYHVYMAIHDQPTDTAGLEFEGIAVLTGAHNTLRWWKS